MLLFFVKESSGWVVWGSDCTDFTIKIRCRGLGTWQEGRCASLLTVNVYNMLVPDSKDTERFDISKINGFNSVLSGNISYCIAAPLNIHIIVKVLDVSFTLTQSTGRLRKICVQWHCSLCKEEPSGGTACKKQDNT